MQSLKKVDWAYADWNVSVDYEVEKTIPKSQRKLQRVSNINNLAVISSLRFAGSPKPKFHRRETILATQGHAGLGRRKKSRALAPCRLLSQACPASICCLVETGKIGR